MAFFCPLSRKLKLSSKLSRSVDRKSSTSSDTPIVAASSETRKHREKQQHEKKQKCSSPVHSYNGDLSRSSPAAVSDGADSGVYIKSSSDSSGGQVPPYLLRSTECLSITTPESLEAKLLQRAGPGTPANLKMTVIRDYIGCCNEELSVRRGQRVSVLYKRNDWAFAVAKNGSRGYIPYSYCRPSRTRGQGAFTDHEGSGYDTESTVLESGYRRHSSSKASGYASCSESQHSRALPATSRCLAAPFRKECIEELVVIHDHYGREENELMVTKGERVKVLNADDPRWLWVATIPGDEGFVPRNCVSFGTNPALQKCTMRRCVSTNHLSKPNTPAHNARAQAKIQKMQARERFRQLMIAKQQRPVVNYDVEEVKRVGSQLIVLADYDPHDSQELSVQLADVLVADMITQTNVDRIWAYNPRTNKLGYVPTSLVQPPVV